MVRDGMQTPRFTASVILSELGNDEPQHEAMNGCTIPDTW